MSSFSEGTLLALPAKRTLLLITLGICNPDSCMTDARRYEKCTHMEWQLQLESSPDRMYNDPPLVPKIHLSSTQTKKAS